MGGGEAMESPHSLKTIKHAKPKSTNKQKNNQKKRTHNKML